MASFNSMPALSSGAAPDTDALGLTASDMEVFNACIAFDDESLLDPTHGLSNLPFTPTPYDLETFSTTFEDPFSYPARPFGGGGGSGGDGGCTGDIGHRAEGYPMGGRDDDDNDAASPPELDNKLLGFGAPIPSGRAMLVSEATAQFVEPHMTGELYGMFFVAEDVFGAESGRAAPRPLELTCYRRNLWQISGQVTLPRGVAHYVDEHGRKGGVAELAASVTAVESIEGRVAEMITIPWRGSNAPVGGDEAKVVSPPPPMVPLDLASGHEVDGGSRVSVPVSWKRLQFKHATANNGRRKGLQQHYVVQINLVVKTTGGEHIKVAEIQSGPVIVRGRSPRNFDSRKEVPLGDKRPMERRGTDGSVSFPSGSSSKQQQQQQQQQQGQHLSQDGSDSGNAPPRYNSVGNLQQPPSDWATPRPHPSPSPQHPSKKIAMSSPVLSRPPVPSWASLANANNNQFPNKPVASTSSGTHKNQRNTSATTPQPLPISLSLSEDEGSPNRSTSGDSNQSPQFSKPAMVLSTSGMGAGRPAAHGGGAHNPLASPLGAEDMLYEYFPLSLDDWMPPVDAIYRPHVVHHTIVPPEVKAQQIRSKAKRYFVAAD
ncbi:p53-like transcription factor [Trichocladium antarcticum]|uniref:P53-like transcription factor n=1 Tax=Trichocladium antarcticum TaxID=1450529 RepID=A0AAN6UN26_9PEZI|nr:p53-like transcription factor [Trichocladium antarcticum]